MSGGSNDSTSTTTPLNAAQRTDLYNAAMGKLQSYLPGTTTFDQAGYDKAMEKYNADMSAWPRSFALRNSEPSRTDFTTFEAAKMAPYEAAQYVNPADYTGAPFTGNVSLADFTKASPYQGMAGGDYNRLEQMLSSGALAGLDTARADALKYTNEDMAKRGVWSSGFATDATGKVNNQYDTTEAQIRADAAKQRYAMEQQDLAGLNTYNQNQAGAQNQNAQFNTTNKNSWADAFNQFNAQQAAAQNAYNQQTAGVQNQFNLTQADQKAKAAQAQWSSLWQPAEYLQGIWNGTGGNITSSNSSSWSI